MLSHYKLPNKYCNKLLTDFEFYTMKVDDLRPYLQGYSPKNKIYYTDTQLICTESHLKYIGIEFEEDTYVDWKQHVIDIDTDNYQPKLSSDLCGTLCTNYITKALLNCGYTKETIEEALNSKQADYDYNNKQYHQLNFGDGLNRFDNCYYYDINGAHNDALCEIFTKPKAVNFFTNLFDERHEKPNNKKHANYYVGNLVHGHEKTYNWIVQRTTAIILDLIDQTDGLVIYANTDGFIIQNPRKLLKTDNLLGGVKEEMPGNSTVYTYRGENYYCIQYRDKNNAKIIKGSLPLELRELIDLEEGKVIKFTRTKNKFGRYEYQNIEQLIIKE